MKKVLSVIGGIICVVICLGLCAIQIVYMTLNSSKSLITKESINEIVKDINFKEVISENPQEASDIYGAFDSLGFSVEETNKILESKSFKEFLNNYIYGNINNIINNEDIEFKFNDIKKLVNDIEKEENISFQNKEEFLKLVGEKFPDIQKNINFSNEINKNIDGKTLEIIKFVTSGILNIAFIILFVFIYLLMCLFRWSVYKPLIWYGITTILSSFLMLQVFLGLSATTSLINDEIEKVKPIISTIIKVIKNKGMIISGIGLVIGILMVVAFCYTNKKIKDKDSDSLEAKLETL